MLVLCPNSKSNTSGSSSLGDISSLETGAGAGLRRSSRSASRYKMFETALQLFVSFIQKVFHPLGFR